MNWRPFWIDAPGRIERTRVLPNAAKSEIQAQTASSQVTVDLLVKRLGYRLRMRSNRSFVAVAPTTRFPISVLTLLSGTSRGTCSFGATALHWLVMEVKPY